MDSGVSGVVQYNSSGGATHIAQIRGVVEKAATPLEAALGVTHYLNMTDGDGAGACVDNSINAFYKELGDDSLPDSGSGNAGRTWTWQTCNEFGYFQTSTAVWGKTSLYTRGASSRAIWQGVCSDLFGIAPEEIGARVAATNSYYGAKQPQNISRVVYSNGELDPWSLLAIKPEDGVPPDTSSVVGALGSHCVGLSAPKEGEIPGATVVRDHAIKKFQDWGLGDGKTQLVV